MSLDNAISKTTAIAKRIPIIHTKAGLPVLIGILVLAIIGRLFWLDDSNEVIYRWNEAFATWLIWFSLLMLSARYLVKLNLDSKISKK